MDAGYEGVYRIHAYLSVAQVPWEKQAPTLCRAGADMDAEWNQAPSRQFIVTVIEALSPGRSQLPLICNSRLEPLGFPAAIDHSHDERRHPIMITDDRRTSGLVSSSPNLDRHSKDNLHSLKPPLVRRSNASPYTRYASNDICIRDVPANPQWNGYQCRALSSLLKKPASAAVYHAKTGSGEGTSLDVRKNRAVDGACFCKCLFTETRNYTGKQAVQLLMLAILRSIRTIAPMRGSENSGGCKAVLEYDWGQSRLALPDSPWKWTFVFQFPSPSCEYKSPVMVEVDAQDSFNRD
ncbi:uncharacterized protein FOMMEDRAFT_155261 [Fomitiporia mediterranea MF3/22]|uniref:uncharacterized protein n=1 Tax=Fomitiporia mediterranea (strain MF3/22) TaxID=694068 RepID=UPI00044084E4|nr:uncharacterized protein FOMMEDRAFT_155261 [Fomitiporia mediterranea MF3/22]EJD04138.1 hypothetical protein FOMMEDRAFT_155261 [Fomitiporia mediterranea MF3/22]